MNYKTIDELNNFDFSESVISEVETMNGTFHLWLDNVTILPECSCNRDIRVMRANGFLLSVSNPGIQEFIEEGYKRYNADNVLQMTEFLQKTNMRPCLRHSLMEQYIPSKKRRTLMYSP